ncbi:MAG: succinate--CoA ligase subunit alpha [Parcubacteria group bacterium]|jgi:succinyl-CoA synthetase alpha subunit|nr:succinate--CoA ligase subunit alpha [Parcubacteria group bacterium]|tara:strand:+ start:9984 stop:10889 length:906 start_codon:yes stop_codon:yes gene_type:complete
MSILINQNTNVVVQGMTGKEGSRAAQSMIESGIKVSCGVTPGKGGQKVLDLPIFDSVLEAFEHDGTINTSVLFVPPLMVLDAALEAINGGVKVLVIITENVPVPDSAKIIEQAKLFNCQVVGPSSVGILNTNLGKLGSIGKPQESKMYSPGNIGIISKSGGMCAETALVLTQKGLGQSTVVGIGGDVLIGCDFVDILKLFEQDEETKVVVFFGEIGGNYEQLVAEAVKTKQFTKPLVAFISGQFAEKIGRSLALGHAGAIIHKGADTAQSKKKVLKEAGVLIADYHYQIPDLVKIALNQEK